MVAGITGGGVALHFTELFYTDTKKL